MTIKEVSNMAINGNSRCTVGRYQSLYRNTMSSVVRRSVVVSLVLLASVGTEYVHSWNGDSFKVQEVKAKQQEYFGLVPEELETIPVFGSMSTNGFYYVDLSVGEPSQTVETKLGSSTSQFTMDCVSPRNCVSPKECATESFNMGDSTTLKHIECKSQTCVSTPKATCGNSGECIFEQKTVLQQGNEATIQGELISDVVTFEHVSMTPVRVENIKCVEQSDNFGKMQNLGMFGLGFVPQNESLRHIQSSLIQEVLQQNNLNQTFSTCLSEFGGVMTLGGFVQDYNVKQDSLTWMILNTREEKITLPLKSMVSEDFSEVDLSTTEVTLSLESFFTKLPQNLFRNFKHVVQESCDQLSHCEVVDQQKLCMRLNQTVLDKLPEFQFRTIGQTMTRNGDLMPMKSVAIDYGSQSYMYQTGEENVYCLAVEELEQVSRQNSIILGMGFFRNKQVTFDMQKELVSVTTAECPIVIERKIKSQIFDSGITLFHQQPMRSNAVYTLNSLVGQTLSCNEAQFVGTSKLSADLCKFVKNFDEELETALVESCKDSQSSDCHLHMPLSKLTDVAEECDVPLFGYKNEELCEVVRYKVQKLQQMCNNDTFIKYHSAICQTVQVGTEMMQAKCSDRTFFNEHRQSCEDNQHYFIEHMSLRCSDVTFQKEHDGFCNQIGMYIKREEALCASSNYFANHVQACEYQSYFINHQQEVCKSLMMQNEVEELTKGQTMMCTQIYNSRIIPAGIMQNHRGRMGKFHQFQQAAVTVSTEENLEEKFPHSQEFRYTRVPHGLILNIEQNKTVYKTDSNRNSIFGDKVATETFYSIEPQKDFGYNGDSFIVAETEVQEPVSEIVFEADTVATQQFTDTKKHTVGLVNWEDVKVYTLCESEVFFMRNNSKCRDVRVRVEQTVEKFCAESCVICEHLRTITGELKNRCLNDLFYSEHINTCKDVLYLTHSIVRSKCAVKHMTKYCLDQRRIAIQAEFVTRCDVTNELFNEEHCINVSKDMWTEVEKCNAHAYYHSDVIGCDQILSFVQQQQLKCLVDSRSIFEKHRICKVMELITLEQNQLCKDKEAHMTHAVRCADVKQFTLQIVQKQCVKNRVDHVKIADEVVKCEVVDKQIIKELELCEAPHYWIYQQPMCEMHRHSQIALVHKCTETDFVATNPKFCERQEQYVDLLHQKCSTHHTLSLSSYSHDHMRLCGDYEFLRTQWLQKKCTCPVFLSENKHECKMVQTNVRTALLRKCDKWNFYVQFKQVCDIHRELNIKQHLACSHDVHTHFCQLEKAAISEQHRICKTESDSNAQSKMCADLSVIEKGYYGKRPEDDFEFRLSEQLNNSILGGAHMTKVERSAYQYLPQETL